MVCIQKKLNLMDGKALQDVIEAFFTKKRANWPPTGIQYLKDHWEAPFF